MSVHGICDVSRVIGDCFQAQISSPRPHAKDKIIKITIVGKSFFITKKPLASGMMNFFFSRQCFNWTFWKHLGTIQMLEIYINYSKSPD